MKPETLDKVLTLISRANDDELNAIANTAVYRRKQLRDTEAELTKAKLRVGARVRVKGTKPKYMNGLTGTVIDARVEGRPSFSRVEIENMPLQGARRFGHTLLLRSSQMEVLD